MGPFEFRGRGQLITLGRSWKLGPPHVLRRQVCALRRRRRSVKEHSGPVAGKFRAPATVPTFARHGGELVGQVQDLQVRRRRRFVRPLPRALQIRRGCAKHGCPGSRHLPELPRSSSGVVHKPQRTDPDQQAHERCQRSPQCSQGRLFGGFKGRRAIHMTCCSGQRMTHALLGGRSEHTTWSRVSSIRVCPLVPSLCCA